MSTCFFHFFNFHLYILLKKNPAHKTMPDPFHKHFANALPVPSDIFINPLLNPLLNQGSYFCSFHIFIIFI